VLLVSSSVRFHTRWKISIDTDIFIHYSVFQYVPVAYLRDSHINPTYLAYPETKGIPLEEMDAVFGESECNFACLQYSVVHAFQKTM